MRREIIYLLAFSLALTVLTVSCSVQKVVKTPYPAKYDSIDEESYNNGFSKQRQPWIVFSDRDKNAISAGLSEGASAFKETSFLDPFIVLKQKKGMFKVAEYKPEMINDGKILKKAIKVSGWIPGDRLLLWNNCLRSSSSGFTTKAALVINDSSIFNMPAKYLENDSVLVFSSPDLINKTKVKLNIGRIVYVYKQSEDKERYLVGNAPAATNDSIKSQIYGWVSRHIVSMWGERTAVKLNAADTIATSVGLYEPATDSLIYKPVINSGNIAARTPFENIYPLQLPDSMTEKGKGTKFFVNTLNYEANKIYNVLGREVYYNRFREILTNNKKLNIVFVLDASQNNRLYMPVVKSLLQELQLHFASPSYFNTVKFGSVVYKQNSCGIKSLSSPLSNNYRDVAAFLEEKTNELCCSDTSIAQPVDKGLLSAANMLANAEDETNVIVLIGTTAHQNYQPATVINALTKVRARLIFFQTQSKSSDAYNDFVLMAENVVVNNAQNVTELKKEKIVNQDDLIIDNSYSLAGGETGIYFLDFPNHSMTQGFVIFPKKGEAMQANLLKNAIDSILLQVTIDNRKIDSSLTAYFRSDIGINNTFMSPEYSALPYYTNKHIPTPMAACLLDKNTSFLINGYLSSALNPDRIGEESGLLLNEQEFDQLNNYYAKVFRETLSAKKFHRRKSVRTYMKLVKSQNPTLNKIRRSTLKKNPLAYSVALNTGFLNQDSIMVNYTVKDLKKNKAIDEETVHNYFRQYKQLAGKMATAKGDEAIRIHYQGQHFYWLNQNFIPTIKEIVSPPVEQVFNDRSEP